LCGAASAAHAFECTVAATALDELDELADVRAASRRCAAIALQSSADSSGFERFTSG
jgi:hypothetical protein